MSLLSTRTGAGDVQEGKPFWAKSSAFERRRSGRFPTCFENFWKNLFGLKKSELRRCDVKLKVLETNPMMRVCSDMRMWCEHVVVGQDEDEEEEGEEEVQEESEDDA